MKRQPAHMPLAQAGAGFVPTSPLVVRAKNTVGCPSQDNACTGGDAGDAPPFQTAPDNASVVAVVVAAANDKAVLSSKIDHVRCSPLPTASAARGVAIALLFYLL